MSTKNPSRGDRWLKACDELRDKVACARTAAEDLSAIRDEFQEWLDNLPENLHGSALGEKLDAVTSIDTDSVMSAFDEIDAVADECEGADLPLGFGRD